MLQLEPNSVYIYPRGCSSSFDPLTVPAARGLAGAGDASVVLMTSTGRVSRALRRIATAPWLITETHSMVAANAAELERVSSNVDAASQAQLEALTLLTRAVSELNSRLEKLTSNPTEPSAP